MTPLPKERVSDLPPEERTALALRDMKNAAFDIVFQLDWWMKYKEPELLTKVGKAVWLITKNLILLRRLS